MTPYRAGLFEYLGFDIDVPSATLTCRYRVNDRDFSEQIHIPEATAPGSDWQQPAVREAARLMFLLAGVSYYKTAAPARIDLGRMALTGRERAFLRSFYLDGLGEFAYRNEMDLSDLQIDAPELVRTAPVAYAPSPDRPLLPFGGGLDSIVSVELVRPHTMDGSLFVVSRPGDRFDAIEEPAKVTGWPVVRAERRIDDQVLRSRELGFLNGHVPVTGVISAIAVLAAVLTGRDAVVMSNEWSASSATLAMGDRQINHQFSKSMRFEREFRAVLTDSIGSQFEYFSLLRPFSELWIAERFAELPEYWGHFRSCNRAFTIDPARRADRWCGECDKCCFIDLILAPFLPKSALEKVFDGREPLENPKLLGQFRNLLAVAPDAKPWECVGDDGECRAAARLAAQREDRSAASLLSALVAEAAAWNDPDPATLLKPLGSHFIPERYAPGSLLV